MKIALATVHGPLEIDAEVYGEWAVHRSPFDALTVAPALEAWTVTHVPTGLRIPVDLTSRVARELAERLSREVPTLGLPAGIATVEPEFRYLGAEYKAHAKRVKKILNEVGT